MATVEQRLKVYDRILATATILITLGGTAFTVWTFFGNEARQRAAESENAREQAAIQKTQLELAIFREKKEIYYELVDAASEIAACQTYEEVRVAQKHFLRLYTGKAHIVADLDEDVKNAKVGFFQLLQEYLRKKPEASPYRYFADSALELTVACSAHLNLKLVYGDTSSSQ